MQITRRRFMGQLGVGLGAFLVPVGAGRLAGPEGSGASFPLTIPAGTEVTHTIDPQTGDVSHVVQETPETIVPIPEGSRRSSGGQLLISETLFRGGANIFGLWKARREREASLRGVDASELELIYEIHKQYYAVLAGEKRVELAREVLDQRDEQLRLARARHDVGSVTMLDVMQAEIDRGNQENALLEERNTPKVARMELNRLMGIPLESEYGMVEAFDTFEPDVDALDLVERAKATRPDLVAIDAREDPAEKESWVQRGNDPPTLSFDLLFFRSAQGAEPAPFPSSPQNRATPPALNLDWQFFSGFSRLSAGRTARVDLENLRYDRRETELLVEKEVKEAVLNLERVYKQSLITRKNRQLATENLRLEQERYRLGSSSLLDLRSAQVTFIEAETEHINKIFEFNSSYAALERATGMPLRE